MPIAVVCAGCQARFNVSDKFAGKKGPCPKCKAIITIPAAPPPGPPVEEVKIHVPEEFRSGGKDSKGRAVSKPIARKEAKFKPGITIAIAGATLLVFGAAFALRSMPNLRIPVTFVGLLAIGPPIAAAGYSFLRDLELEAYHGRSMWLRASICGLVYAALWGAYAVLNIYQLSATEMWQWLFVAPIFVGIGAATSFATFDLDFASGAMHYCFYLIVTLLLRAAMGLPNVWAQVSDIAVLK